MKITDPLMVKNPAGNFYVNTDLDHIELDIICESISKMIHGGITDPDRRDAVLKLYGEMFSFWEATSDDPNPPPPTLIKRDIILAPVCPKNMTWNPVTEVCDPNEGFYVDEFGNVKAIPVTNCGANAHFDTEKGCICDDGFFRDKSGNCVPIVEPEPK